MGISRFVAWVRASLVAQRLKRLPPMWETRVRSLGQEDPLEKEMATHSSILAWRIPWTEEPGGLQSTGSQRVDTTEWLYLLTYLPGLMDQSGTEKPAWFGGLMVLQWQNWRLESLSHVADFLLKHVPSKHTINGRRPENCVKHLGNGVDLPSSSWRLSYQNIQVFNYKLWKPITQGQRNQR